VIEGARKALDRWGYGLSSVRFICGTQGIHKELEARVSEFLGTDDTILYAACFDANGGVFEPFLDQDCALLTDSLNHASIIDGIRLCKATRVIVPHGDMEALDKHLRSEEVQKAKYRMIATDGVFSMDGDIARLDEICALARKHDALVMVDDCHSTGFLGKTGRGTHEHCDVMGEVDLITTTFGKALGGASGGCTSGRKELIEWLRQKSRPYLFSNSLAPTICGATLAALDLVTESTELRDRLEESTKSFRKQMTAAGFDIRPGEHPITPVHFGSFPDDAKLAQGMARDLLAEGIYVIGFSFPVVPKGQARIRVQVSAVHEREHLDRCVEAFAKVGKKHGVVK
jgi:glycine C-acetyltransferase